MRRVLVAAIVVAACNKDKPPEPSKPAAPSASTTASSSASSTTTLPPIPPISAVTRFTLEQKQGGPSLVQCNGVISEMKIDLAKNEWEHGTCLVNKPGEMKRDPLVVDHGALDAEARKRIEGGWDKLRPATGTCGADGGPLTLTVTYADGGTQSWVDNNWGCKKPEPLLAGGLAELSSTITIALANRPKLPKK